MTLLVVGASHHTASFEVLERLSVIDAAELRSDTLSGDGISEVLVLSTCNRVEVYAEVDRFHVAVDVIVDLLADRAGLSLDEMASRCFVHFDGQAVQHMFEVASGLDSMVVGEQQILGQLRSAFGAAQADGSAGRELGDMARAALRVGKDVRSGTGIDRAGASVVSVGLRAALDALEGLGGDSGSPRVAVLGSGSMSGLTTAALADIGIGELTLLSRNREQGRRLAAAHAGTALDLDQLPTVLMTADLLVCCTGASDSLVSRADVAGALPGRDDRPLVVLDLALPHDADPEIAELAGVARIDLADLSRRPDSRPDLDDVAAARKLVDEELGLFAQQRAERAVEPVVRSLRSRATTVADAELARMRGKLAGLDDEEWEHVVRGMRRVVAALLHTPTVRVKQFAIDPDGQRYAQALSSLFDLSADVVDAVVLPLDPTRELPGPGGK